MIIDCHAHFEPRLLNEKQIIRNMDQVGIDKTCLIPLLTDPPESKKPDFPMKMQRFMFNSNLLRPLGIAITKSMYQKKGEWKLWFNKNKSTSESLKLITDPDNQSVANLISKHPDRFLGWIFINPSLSNALDELEKWRNTPGMIGVKIHPFWHQYSIEVASDLVKRVQELKLPLCVHLGFGSHGNYRWLLESFPNLTIIFSHLGVPYYKNTWHLAKQYLNVFFDISSTYHVDKKLLNKSIKIIGPEKCLFGTDTPYAHADAALRIKQWVEDLSISDIQKEQIFSENFLKLIKI